jgi:hypothetical protein
MPAQIESRREVVAVNIYFTGDRVVRTSDESNIVEVARALGEAATGVRFAEIKTQGETRIFVNPATVAYLQEAENGGSVGFS